MKYGSTLFLNRIKCVFVTGCDQDIIRTCPEVGAPVVDELCVGAPVVSEPCNELLITKLAHHWCPHTELICHWSPHFSARPDYVLITSFLSTFMTFNCKLKSSILLSIWKV